MKKYYIKFREERNIPHTIKEERKANWIGHILHRKCLPKHVIEGKINGKVEGMGRRGRRRTKVLNHLNERRTYWKLKEEALDRDLWKTRFGRGYGHVVRRYQIMMIFRSSENYALSMYTNLLCDLSQ
jgi:hypothetical protein